MSAISVNTSSILSYRYDHQSNHISGVLLESGGQIGQFVEKLVNLSQIIRTPALPVLALVHHSLCKLKRETCLAENMYYKWRNSDQQEEVQEVMKASLNSTIYTTLNLQKHSTISLVEFAESSFRAHIDDLSRANLDTVMSILNGLALVAGRLRDRSELNHKQTFNDVQHRLLNESLHGTRTQAESLKTLNLLAQRRNDMNERAGQTMQKLHDTNEHMKAFLDAQAVSAKVVAFITVVTPPWLTVSAVAVSFHSSILSSKTLTFDNKSWTHYTRKATQPS